MITVYIAVEHIPAFLVQEARRLQDPRIAAVRPERLRQWVHRDKVQRGPLGYDALSLGAHLERVFGRVA